jgi:putative ABC transport system permease protein
MMALLRRTVGRLHGLIDRTRAEQALDDELRDYLEASAAQHVADGLSPEDALRAARLALGSMEAAKEAVRDVGWETLADGLAQDVRQAGRRLRLRPVTSLAAIGMLGLAIGITTSMFTIVDALLLRPVPFRDADRLAQVVMNDEHGGRSDVARPVLAAWREMPVFEAVAGHHSTTSLIESGDHLIERPTAYVTPGLFEMLGVRPIRGRGFEDGEGRAGTTDRAVISEDLWRSAFGADPALVGGHITVNREPLTVVGILPADFRFPTAKTELWRPIDYDAPPSEAMARPTALVRIAAGVPKADVLRMATTVARTADPSTNRLQALARPLAGAYRDTYLTGAVPLLAGGVLLVFLVLCANVSSLLLERFTSRRREFAMCSALGASRGRLFRQALVESATFGLLGAALGIAVASTLVAVARGFLPESFLLQTLNPLNVDYRAIAAASFAGFAATVIAGLIPAWIGTTPNTATSLRVIDRGGTETRAARSVTRALSIGEIALTCALLVGATLLVRSFVNLSRADRGLNSRGVVTTSITFSKSLEDSAARTATTSLLLDTVRHMPGVSQVALSFGVPPGGGGISFDEWRPDTPGSAPVRETVERYWVSADFFDLYGIHLLAGRTFRPQDSSGDAGGQAIVSERFAAAMWPGTNAVGHTFTSEAQHFEVVGIAKEINHPSMDVRQDHPEFYEPFTAGGTQVMMSIRCESACPDTPLIRQRLTEASPLVRVLEARALDSVYFKDLATPRAAAAMGFAFATVAIVAAASGLFTVLSYGVSRRRREFGIRTALGSSAAQIRGLVLREGLTVALAGVAIGSVAAWWLARGLASLEYGVTNADPVTWSIVLGVIALTTIAASWQPARHATHVDPVTLLREE